MADTKRQVFFSFHYENDCRRTAQVRNIGVIQGDVDITDNTWEKVKVKDDSSIKKWIKDQLKMRSCLIVLVGEETSNRKWVNYEIEEAWNSGKGVLGIYIHNIKDPITGKCNKGKNPFEKFTLKDGRNLSEVVECHNPNSDDAYNDIANHIYDWVEDAIKTRKKM